MKKTEYAKYLITFIVTAGLFATIFYVSKITNDARVKTIKSEQDVLSINLLSSEVQFSLLKTGGCTEDGNSILAPEIGSLGQRLAYMENQLGADNQDVINLKKYYSLLQIKDYMLMKELGEKCNFKPITIVYFYSNNECEDCTKQGYVLTALREKYPLLRIYSFDANLDLSAIKTLQTVTKAPDEVPSLIINGKVYTGFKSIEDIEKVTPALTKMLADQKAAEEKAAKAEKVKTTQ